MSKKILILPLFTLLFLLCQVQIKAAVKISPQNLYLKKGESGTLKISDIKKKAVWKSDMASVASLSSTGKYTARVYAKNPGKATVSSSGKKATIWVMAISRTKLELTPEESAKLYLKNINNGKITWKSDNTKIARVSADGKVTAISAGRTNVSANCRGKSFQCTIYVPSLSLQQDELLVGEETKAAIGNTIAKINFTSSDPSVASIDNNGKIKGLKAGKTTILSKGYNEKGKCITQLKRTVTVRDSKNEMVQLIKDLSSYTHKKNPAFAMITNGGYGIYCPEINKNISLRKKFLSAIDGVLVEDVFYGWNGKLNKATPSGDKKKILSAFAEAKKAGKPCFVLDYCTGSKAGTSLKKSLANGLVCYTSPSLNLDKCPAASSSNTMDCTKLSDVKNYMILLDPSVYQTKEAYLKALENTDYDMIFIDMYYTEGYAISKEDIDKLKKKKNGGKRLVCTYISIGEAEDYRGYWKDSWNKTKPSWICAENSQWNGNYKVKFWTPEWKAILKDYFDKAISTGFDGAYLDVIDAYEYFDQ